MYFGLVLIHASLPVFHPHGLMFHLDFPAVPLQGLKVSLKQQWTDFSLNRIQSIGKRARNRLFLFYFILFFCFSPNSIRLVCKAVTFDCYMLVFSRQILRLYPVLFRFHFVTLTIQFTESRREDNELYFDVSSVTYQ